MTVPWSVSCGGMIELVGAFEGDMPMRHSVDRCGATRGSLPCDTSHD